MSTKSRTSAVIDKPLPLDRVAVHSGPFNRNVNKGFACSGQIEPRKLIKKTAFIKTVSGGSRQEGGKSSDGQIDTIRKKQYVGQDYVVSDCWGTNDALPVKFIEPLKESCLEDDPYTKKQKLGTDANNKKSPPYTKEFHVLTEVQKTRILRVVEDVVKKLAHEDSTCFNMSPGGSQLPLQSSSGKLVYRKFSLPWIVIKIIEMVGYSLGSTNHPVPKFLRFLPNFRFCVTSYKESSSPRVLTTREKVTSYPSYSRTT